MSREEQVIEEKLENLLNAIIIYAEDYRISCKEGNHGEYIGVIKDG